MRKISKTRSARHDRYALEVELPDTRPRRIQGATITSWSGPPDIDLTALFARPASGVTVTGAAPDGGSQKGCPPEGTVSLSDGTRIKFATTN